MERVREDWPDASSMFSQDIPSFFLFIFSSVLSYFLFLSSSNKTTSVLTKEDPTARRSG